MKRRPAVTLIEALMAIFVMAIGLLALLTLFPLGAVQMAQALKDERTAQSGLISIAQFKVFDLGNDPFVNSTNFENPYPGVLPQMTTGVATSYPVWVDPIGTTNGAVVPVGNALLGIPRVSVSRLPQQSPLQPTALPGQTPAWASRWFTMPDDHTYADNGVPDLASLGNPVPTVPPPSYAGQNTIAREGRYTWAYMVRRQTAMVPSPPVTPGSPPVPPINLSVVVFSGRLAGVDFAGNPLGETLFNNVTYGPAPDNSPNVVRIDWTGQTRPTLRRGSWVLDARMLPVPSLAPGTQLPGLVTFFNVPQGYFYRVVSVNDVAPTVIDVEVQRPLGGPMRGPYGPAGGGAYYTGPLVAVDNISEVFDKDTNY
jgi:hypothetical protein